jgi:sulfur carrier protein ThiS
MTTPAPSDPASTAAPTPTITVHPHGELSTYFGRSYGGVPVPIEPGITIEGLLERLGIPAKEVWLVAKNGDTVKRDVTLDPGDTVELFAPVAGG